MSQQLDNEEGSQAGALEHDDIHEQAQAMLENERSDTSSHKGLMIAIVSVLILLFGGLSFIGLFGDSTDSDDEPATNQQTEQTNTEATEETVAVRTNQVFKSDYQLAATEDCTEVGNFVDVAKFDGPGGNYDQPSLEVACDGDDLTVSSNNMPLWEFVELTPNPLTPQDYSWTIPRQPAIADEPTQIGYQDASNSMLGALGFSVSGLVWYGPTEGPQPDPFGDPFSNAIIDECGGHTGPNSEYHLHIMATKCFFPDWDESQAAPIVGYALDGFPIYGPTGIVSADSDQVVEFKSSYKETGDIKEYAWDNVTYEAGQGEQYLDECNGRTQPDGSYGYHLTAGFPYIVGCLMGEADLPSGAGGAGGVPAGPGQQQGPPPRN